MEEELKLKHLGCFAHTLNLIACDATNNITGLLNKIKSIVAFFKRSSSALARFNEQQKQLSNKEPKKLVQSVATRWNSTYYMIERFSELEEPLRTTMALVTTKELLIVSIEEWDFLKEMIKVLKPLETVTTYISGQNYVTASSLIIITDGLFRDVQKF
ncbi:hypothetical protein NQ314_013934 [Rhamnusium bicolor]|uniref:Zinc finger BED domain-containing protein 4 n=1 Tax=Rhamnusium bicolor TaxID=1586634 RepID=A0AAV8X465_9CUCU|nr:hypothetical protein NQ314_013934 [Rhamnusium bicolor]